MELTQIICDGCGATKGIANHWFQVAINKQGALVIATSKFAIIDQLGVAYGPKEILHLCGSECTLKRVSEFVGQGK